MDRPTPDPPPDLEPGDAHVWRVDLGRSPTDLEQDRATLSADERRRVDRFRLPGRGDHYAAAHAAMRTILARYLGLVPAAIRYHRGPAGKPFLAPGLAERDLRFNLTDSGGLALVAVTEGREIGVDLERHRELPVQALADRWLTPPEAAAIHSQPEARRAAAFFACWTRKEAYVKARGGSIIRSLATFSVTVDPDAERVELTVPDDPEAGRRWWVSALDAGTGFSAAVAAEGRVRIRSLRWA